MKRFRFPALVALVVLGLVGQTACRSSGERLPAVVPNPFHHPVVPNPLLVPAGDFEVVWNRTVATLDRFFDVASENRLTRRIVTNPKVGATVLEPWDGDSVGFRERLESTLQSIHRFAVATVTDAPGGGYLVRIEVYKELEDMIKPERQQGGLAVFPNDFPINRTREVIGPVPLPSGWIPRGRDPKLEQKMLHRLRREFFL
jgi:hypothetical protein